MPTWKNQNEAYDFVDNVFLRAARIVADGVHVRVSPGNWVTVREGREWFNQQHQRHRLHPAVCDIMTTHMRRAEDWQQLLLEWPHKSITDPNRLAYTRNEQSAMHNGDSDAKAVVTTIGKYLTRHFPDAPSNLIRDIVAQYTYGGAIVITQDMDAMVGAVTNGPRSCMSNRFDIRCDDGKVRHPYEVYDPSLGWRMAVRSEDGEVMGRCLVLDHDVLGKGFVRSYKRERNSHSNSGADESIEAYLRGVGYERWREWPEGASLMRYEVRGDGYLMPYIDGGNQHVDEKRDIFEIVSCGHYDASNTSGVINSYTCTCEDCGDGMDEDDSHSIGYGGDRTVGPCCIDNYTYVYGYRGNEYYVHNDNAIEADGEWYHDDYLSDNSIVELNSGDYTHIDNAVYVESADAYYHVDDDDICYTDDSNTYELKEDCWRCTESGNWYTPDTDSVEVDGDLYHPDHAPEPETNEPETN